jgi:hypothetical protein
VVDPFPEDALNVCESDVIPTENAAKPFPPEIRRFLLDNPGNTA